MNGSAGRAGRRQEYIYRITVSCNDSLIDSCRFIVTDNNAIDYNKMYNEQKCNIIIIFKKFLSAVD